MPKKYLASTVLIVMIVLFALTFIWKSDTFLWNLINHGLAAGIIGGLADWFGVTALFKKPFGVSYGTEIIPKNYKKLTADIAEVIGNKLLTPENIMRNIRKYNVLDLVIAYYDKKNNKQKMQESLHTLINELLNFLDTQDFAANLTVALKKRRDNFNMSKYIINYLSKLIKSDNGDKLIDKFVPMTRTLILKLLQEDKAKNLIRENVDIMKKRYIEMDSGITRDLAMNHLDFLNDGLVANIEDAVNTYAKNLLNHDSTQRREFKQFLIEKLEWLNDRDGYREKLVKLEHRFFVKKLDFKDEVADLLKNNLMTNEGREKVFKYIDDEIESKIENLKSNEAQKKEENAKFINEFLQGIVETCAPQISGIIKDKLHENGKEKFVNLIKDNVGDDLQMIRFNGSLVGGVTGIGLYTVFWAMEKVFG